MVKNASAKAKSQLSQAETQPKMKKWSKKAPAEEKETMADKMASGSKKVAQVGKRQVKSKEVGTDQKSSMWYVTPSLWAC